MSTPRPLDGITVISLEHAIAAPFCTRQLADLGARVIKIERPNTGDFARSYDNRARGMSSHFAWTNRSKESLTLDLKSPRHKDILMQLIGKSDIVVQNLAPGAMDRLGLNFSALQQIRKDIILCNISGYGADGPYFNKKAYDLLIQAESGFLSITGDERGFAKAGCSIADISAGMYAYSAILSALIQRHRTAQGYEINVSMLDCMGEWMGFPLYYSLDDASPPSRCGDSHATIYPYGSFSCGDKEIIMLAVQNEREWAQFCDFILEQSNLKTDARFRSNALRAKNRDDLREIILKRFSQINSQDLIAILDRNNIANAIVRDMKSVWNHPQFLARGRITEVDSPVGKLPTFLPPAIPEGIDPVMGSIPDLGKHTEAILTELGLTLDDLNARNM